MKKAKHLLIKSLSLSCFIMIFILPTYASETASEDPVIEVTNGDEATEDESVSSDEPVNAFISIDLGYELLFTVDENGMILDVEAMTESDTVLLDGKEMINVSITDAIQSLLDETPEGTETSLMVLSDDESLSNTLSESLISSFGEIVESYQPIEEDSTPDDPTVDDPAVDDPTVDDPAVDDPAAEDSEERPDRITERLNLAKDLGISPGKMNLIQKLETSFYNNEETDYTYWAEKSVKEIMKKIIENKRNQFKSQECLEVDDEDFLETIDNDEAGNNEIEDFSESDEENEYKEAVELQIKPQRKEKPIKSKKSNNRKK